MLTRRGLAQTSSFEGVAKSMFADPSEIGEEVERRHVPNLDGAATQLRQNREQRPSVDLAVMPGSFSMGVSEDEHPHTHKA